MATINGTNNGDNLDGSDLADQIFGLGGNDILIGFDGDDELEGGAGADQLFGSSGFDFASYPGSSRTPPWPSRCLSDIAIDTLGKQIECLSHRVA